uniref:Reverse transcriptase zinc-binding domain-containing protein n=1 Tax=Cannabis sativa TaxID=3483 RepID=A0A803PUK6_CANSA
MHSRFTLVKFRDETTRDMVLEAGVIHFDKKPVILRPWTTEMDAAKMINSVPVWIRLNGLGLQYWGKKNLSALVSTIGKPIMIDKVTQDRSMVKFARILVDMVISEDPLKSISFINERKQLMEQLIEYEWIPSKCSACGNLGHIVANCHKEQPVVWRKKQTGDIKASREEKKEKHEQSAMHEMAKKQPGNNIRSEGYGEGPIRHEAEIQKETDLEVEEFKCSGAYYTWNNKHEVGERIFSKLDRVFFNNEWLRCFAEIDACFKWETVSDHSLCFIRNHKVNKVGIKPFRYCNHWATYPTFRKTVLAWWDKHTGGSCLDRIVKKLLRVKHALKKFSRHEVGDIREEYQQARDEYCRIQEETVANPGDLGLQSVSDLKQQEFLRAQNRYNQFVGQQRKIKWPKFNDENSSFFHATMRKRRLENRITTFVKDGTVVDDYEDVTHHFVSHFEKFMGSKSSASTFIEEDCIKQGNRLNVEQEVRLIRPFTMGDVKKGMFSIHSSKSPGLDGFRSSFFKDLWSEIGNEVSKAILDFFDTEYLPNELNETVISLIPIACCNTAYKCISKMICSRLTEVLPSLIQGNQGAFIKNRLLAHNIMIFQDLLKGYTRKNVSARYDLVLFSKGNLNSVKIIQESFSKFCNATGLSANKAKSQIFFGGVKEDVKQKILELVQIEEGSFPLKYLGVNLRTAKWKASDCGVILDKVNRNLNCWASKNLSFTGRAQLIHSVLLGIRNYWMSIFIIPQKIAEAIDKSCQDFLWGKKENRSKFHLASWEKVCLPKKLGGIGFREGKKWNKALIAKGSTSEADLNLAVNGKKFQASKFYNMQLKENKVKYAGAVWDKLVLPKHRFIYWQVVNSQLITRDLLNRFVPIPDVNCPVYHQAEENYDHVFFECPFSLQVAAKVKEWLGQVHWLISVKDLSDKCSTTQNNFRNRVINS